MQGIIVMNVVKKNAVFVHVYNICMLKAPPISLDFGITQTTFRRRRSEVIIYKHSQSLIILSRFQFSIKCIFIFSPLQFQCDFSNTMNHLNNQCLLLQSIWMIFNQILTSFNFLFKKILYLNYIQLVYI